MGWVVFANKIKNIAFQKEPIFLLNGEVIWQASDSPLSKELHGQTVGLFHVRYHPLCQMQLIYLIVETFVSVISTYFRNF